MKVIFAGTSSLLALPILNRIFFSNICQIVAVYTCPDRYAGRGKKLTISPVKQFASIYKIPIYQPSTFNNKIEIDLLEKLNCDVFISADYGIILPDTVLNIPKYGCINVHPSLLPKWRGAAPVQRAILAGDKITGISITKTSRNIDSGDIYKQSTLYIDNDDTSVTLLKKLAILGAELLLDVLTELCNNNITPVIQKEISKFPYAHKILKNEGYINWYESAYKISLMVRAFNPWPIAFTEIDDIFIKIWKVAVVEKKNRENILPGTIIRVDKTGIEVVTGEGNIILLNIQLPNKTPLHVADIINANNNILIVGKRMTNLKK